MHQDKPAEMRDQWLIDVFTAAHARPVNATEFVDEVMKRIQRRARVRFSILGAGGLAACFIAVFAAREVGAKLGGYALGVAEYLDETLGQLAAVGTMSLEFGASALPVLVAFASIIAALPLLRWLAD